MQRGMTLQVLYADAYLVAINKPHGLLVHRSGRARDAKVFALQEVRNQLGGQHVYPVHRLDRKTAGVLLFARNQAMETELRALFARRQMEKVYWAVLRGWAPEEGIIDYALKNEDTGEVQEAVTEYTRLATTEIDVPLGKFATSRYCWVEARPQTGRMHQLRKHFAHLNYPIIADRPHGCNKQNKLWKERFGMETMLLHARRLAFDHPATGGRVDITAPLFPEYERALGLMNFS